MIRSKLNMMHITAINNGGKSLNTIAMLNRCSPTEITCSAKMYVDACTHDIELAADNEAVDEAVQVLDEFLQNLHNMYHFKD